MTYLVNEKESKDFIESREKREWTTSFPLAVSSVVCSNRDAGKIGYMKGAFANWEV